MKKLCFTFRLLAALLLFFPAAAGTAISPSFAKEEKLTYRIRWSFLLAGHTTLETKKGKEIDGEPTIHFVMTTKTTPFIDNFYKVRDVIESHAARDLDHSLRYTKKQQGKTKRDIVVTFDRQKGLARYENFGKSRTPISIRPGTIDPLAALYYIRWADFQNGPLIERPVSDGKYNEIGKAMILRREQIHVPAGTFQTVVIKPSLEKVRGVFEKSKNSTLLLWITDDANRRLIKAASSVSVGSFVAELIAAE